MAKGEVRLFGCHVSAAGGLVNAVRNGAKLGVNSIQVHATPPQRWNSKPSPQGVEEAFLAELPDSGIKAVFFHGIYLINLANPDPSQFHLSKTSLINSLDLMGRINGDGVIFHMGSMKDQTDEEVGYKQVASGINEILRQASAGRLILEVAAGSGKIIGDRFEELARVYEMVEDKARVGFGLDTQHMWASGYDLQQSLEEIVGQVERILGLDKVWAVHLNDSKTELGSRRDRHENLGDGLIGMEALRNFCLHPKLSHIPFILETPALADLETAAGEVAKLRSMLF